MVNTKPIEYYITKKGKEFNNKDPKYLPEEREIIESLKDYRRSTNSILLYVNETLQVERTWYYIERLINNLKREGYINVYKEESK